MVVFCVRSLRAVADWLYRLGAGVAFKCRFVCAHNPAENTLLFLLFRNSAPHLPPPSVRQRFKFAGKNWNFVLSVVKGLSSFQSIADCSFISRMYYMGAQNCLSLLFLSKTKKNINSCE